MLYDTNLNPSGIAAVFLKEFLFLQSMIWNCAGDEAEQCSKRNCSFQDVCFICCRSQKDVRNSVLTWKKGNMSQDWLLFLSLI